MLYFTSDLHFGHENLLQSRTSFSAIEEMDERLIQNWNKKVEKRDEVYILGDFSFRAKKSIHTYLKRLNGKKHLIIGNHDGKWMKEIGNLSAYFASVSDIKTIRYEKQELVLCHYPMLEWPGKYYLLHGHIHGNKNTMTYHYIKKNLSMALNCSVDINQFEPVTLQELLKNNEVWYERRIYEKAREI
jgi:calcineurin-like phosphoesterase family protein